jgi:hypothetical protein
VRTVSILLTVCGLTLTVASSAQPRFDPEDVVRRVRSARLTPQPLDPSSRGLDDGEFLIDTSVTLVPATDDQSEPAVAFDSTNFLVVWQDYRSGVDHDIYGARVTPQGTVLDPSGFVISYAAHGQGSPALAFDGTNFLVVWQDHRAGSDIYGARVTAQGVVLDTAGFAVSQAADSQCVPVLAFDGTNFLVAWEDWRNGGDCDIHGTRVTPRGVILDSAEIIISCAAWDQWAPAVSVDGANFLVVWQDYRGSDIDIYGARVTPQGAVLDSSGLVISQATGWQESPGIAFDGANYLVAWRDCRDGGSDIYGARMTPQGTVLDSAGFVISHAANGQYSPALAFDGVGFLVAWRDYRGGRDYYDIYGTRVTPQGVVLDSAGIYLSQAADYRCPPALAFDGANLLVAWEDWSNGSNYVVFGARVTPEGSVLDSAGVVISCVANGQSLPRIASDGVNFLVVWQDDRNGGDYDIFGARVTPEGTVLDPSGFVISHAAYEQGSPSVDFDGANFLVVWHDDRNGCDYDILGARVTPEGTVLDPSGFVISQAASDQYYPAVGFDGANSLVVWEDFRSGGWAIYGARVTPQGTVLDSAGFVVSQAGYEITPCIGFDGVNFLVAWADYRSGSDYDIYGARVTPQGTLLDSSGIAIARAGGDQEYPALCSDGTNSLVVWQFRRNGGRYWDIYGARVTPQGAVLDPAGIVISRAAGDKENPALGFDGADFLVVWEDSRNGGYWDIYGARVTPGGTVFDSGPVVTQAAYQVYPALACGSGSDAFLVYQGWTGSIGGTTYNTYRIWGMLDPNPGVAETPGVQVRTREQGATFVRGVLFLPRYMTESSDVSDRVPNLALLDISGRKVLDLKPGPNDVRALAPGVYFVRGPETEDGRPGAAVRKVVVAR